MAPTRDPSQTKYTVQNMGNTSFDEDYGVNAVEVLGEDTDTSPNVLRRIQVDPNGVTKTTGSDYAIQLDDTTTADVVYVGFAQIGTATSAASWQIMNINNSSGIVITWADGDNNFDNVWDDRASLSYS